MISIIICARNNDISESLKYNIQSTIGTDYELVIVDNHDDGKSIFKAYNEGVSHAKGEILCFMHDDIILHSNGWGLSVEKYFKDSSIGAIGIVGSHIIPRVGDWRVGYTDYLVLNFMQRTYTIWSGRYYSRQTQEGLSGALTDVATIDGVKRRVRAGMGRCQGGFCMPLVVKTIAEETSVDFCSVQKGDAGSYVAVSQLKSDI